MTVWAGRSGRLTRALTSSFQAALQATVTAAMAVPCWGIVLLGAGMVGRRLLDARRLAAWDADWQAMDRPGPAVPIPGPSAEVNTPRRCGRRGQWRAGASRW